MLAPALDKTATEEGQAAVPAPTVFTIPTGPDAHGSFLPAPDGRLCGISLLPAGDMALSRRAAFPDRARFLAALGVPADRVFALRQVHSRRVVVLAGLAPQDLEATEADGMLSDRQDVLLTVTVADCLPIVLVDTRRGVFGIVHSGWKGTGIAAEAVRLMRESFGTRPPDIAVTIGPGIGACCYRVPGERAALFEAEHGPGTVVYGADGTPRLDLRAANVALLERAGVENIAVASDCTCCTPDLASFRRQGAAQFTLMLAYVGGVAIPRAPAGGT